MFSVVQDGDLIGYVKNPNNATELPMYNYWARSTKIFKDGKYVGTIGISKNKKRLIFKKLKKVI